MTALFKEGIPAQDTPIRSVEIRDNFGALYDKLRTLEPRATTPESTQLLINGGPVYFRAGDSILYNQLGVAISGSQRLIIFQTSIIDLATANGFRTIKNPNGSLSKEPVIGGISPFEENGLFREILITLNSQGRLSFTEGATTTTGLSRVFDIAFDDSEIPICLVVVQQFGTLNAPGQLAPIRQIDITDIRPIVTTAFQNNLSGASLEQNVLDTKLRVDALEQSVVSDMLRVQIPSFEQLTLDSTTTTNRKIEIASGAAYINGKRITYPGGTILVTQDLPSGGLPINNYAIACVALVEDSLLPGVGKIVLYHSTAADSKNNPESVPLPSAVRDPSDPTGLTLKAPANGVPLALLYYRMDSIASGSTPGYTTQIKPIASDVFVDPTFNGDGTVSGGVRFVFAFDIVALGGPDRFTVAIPNDVDENSVFLQGDTIEIFDNNTRSFRRQITNNPQGTFDANTRRLSIVVSETFVNDASYPNASKGLSLKRSPKATIITKKPGVVLQDVRPFIMEP